MKLNQYIDHTKLGPVVSSSDVDTLIQEAIKYQFKSICIPPTWVEYAKEKLMNQGPLVCTVIGFPHGSQTIKTKVFETKDAIKNGADEIDMVANIELIKSRNTKVLVREIKSVVKAAASKCVKVIVETALLDDSEIAYATRCAIKGGANFIKTSTGYSLRGANLKDIKIMKKASKDLIEIKASGGIKTYQEALDLIQAGATRIGTSRGVSLINPKEENNDANASY